MVPESLGSGGRVFTANMTGNIVLLGFGIAGSGGLPVVAPIVSLGAFLAGSAVGGAMAVRIGQRHAEHVTRALGIEAGLVLVAAIVAAADFTTCSSGERWEARIAAGMRMPSTVVVTSCARGSCVAGRCGVTLCLTNSR